MRRTRQISLSLVTLIAIAFASGQERWSLRFSLKEGVPLDWHMRIVTKRVIDKKAEVEVTDLWVREQVEQIRPNGNLVWASQVTRCVINGEVIPADKLERTVSELTPFGYPAHPITIPPPSLNQLNDWLLDLFGGVSLVFPLSEIGTGDRWQHQILVGLKPPNEPRRLMVIYRLEGKEIVDGRECFKVSVQLQSPVKLAWEWKDASIIVTGGAKVEGAFWFDPALGSIRQKRVNLSIGYTVESERWDGFQFVQTAKFVNQTTEVEGRLLSPK